jgi:hypothetical protein
VLNCTNDLEYQNVVGYLQGYCTFGQLDIVHPTAKLKANTPKDFNKVIATLDDTPVTAAELYSKDLTGTHILVCRKHHASDVSYAMNQYVTNYNVDNLRISLLIVESSAELSSVRYGKFTATNRTYDVQYHHDVYKTLGELIFTKYRAVNYFLRLLNNGFTTNNNRMLRKLFSILTTDDKRYVLALYKRYDYRLGRLYGHLRNIGCSDGIPASSCSSIPIDSINPRIPYILNVRNTPKQAAINYEVFAQLNYITHFTDLYNLIKENHQ